MRKFLKQRLSPSMVIALVALFVALGGTTYAATGGNFILGQSNTATTQTALSSNVASAPTLNLVNTGGRPAARFQANAGKAVFTVSNSTKIANLNADLLDGINADALGVKELSGSGAFSDLCTAAATWTECSQITVTVPAGKTYVAAVTADGNMYETNTTNRVLFCASARLSSSSGPTCIRNQRGILLKADDMGAISDTAIAVLGSGTWVLSTGVNPQDSSLNFRGDFDVGIIRTSAIIADSSAGPAVAALIKKAATR